MLQKIQRKSKIEFYQERFIKFKGQSRKLWNLTNSILGKQRNKTDLITMIRDRNNKTDLTDAKDIADVFADHFANIGKKLSQNLPITKLQNKMERFHGNMFMLPTDETEIATALTGLKQKK